MGHDHDTFIDVSVFLRFKENDATDVETEVIKSLVSHGMRWSPFRMLCPQNIVSSAQPSVPHSFSCNAVLSGSINVDLCQTQSSVR